MQRGRSRDDRRPTKTRKSYSARCREVSKCSVSVSLAHEGLRSTFRASRGCYHFPLAMLQCEERRDGRLAEPLACSLPPSHTAHLPWSRSWRGGEEGVSQWAVAFGNPVGPSCTKDGAT